MNTRTISWMVFVITLLGVVLFITQTSAALPQMVASHFDAAGNPTAFMTRAGYVRFISILSTAVPIATVTLLWATYSRAADMKLPNREYWLDPRHIGRTRAILVTHGIWFGSLLCGMVGYVHWLELGANRLRPPHLATGEVFAGLLVFCALTAGWLLTVVIVFRRPPLDS